MRAFTQNNERAPTHQFIIEIAEWKKKKKKKAKLILIMYVYVSVARAISAKAPYIPPYILTYKI